MAIEGTHDTTNSWDGGFASDLVFASDIAVTRMGRRTARDSRARPVHTAPARHVVIIISREARPRTSFCVGTGGAQKFGCGCRTGWVGSEPMGRVQRVHHCCASPESCLHRHPRRTMASMMSGAFTVVTEDTIKKLNTDKIVASDVAPTIGGVTEANFKVYLQELCQAVVTVSACSLRPYDSPCAFACPCSSNRRADGNPTRVRCGSAGACVSVIGGESVDAYGDIQLAERVQTGHRVRRRWRGVST